ncbi:MAG: alpha/beta fold hydrolase [Myxococcales bacterium]
MIALLLALAVTEGDVTVRDFRFASGAAMPSLRLHYRTIGSPESPAVLVLHGTTGSGAQFLGDSFAGALFGPGQLLSRYFIVLPDDIGHGGSSKPSDGLRGRFPRYGYGDMVAAERAVLDHLGVKHLRLIVGTSMGCMHAWMWLEKWPEFADAALPLACLPVQIAGRNRMLREMAVSAIRADPAFRGGDYTSPPLAGLRGALEVLFFMTSSPLVQQSQAPTRDAADKLAAEWMAKRLATAEANDFIDAFESSRDYDPSADLEKIQAAVTAVNSADDQVNPPELGILERELKRVKPGKAVVLPIGPQTRGHGTHTNAAAWKGELSALLDRSAGSREQ